MSDIKLAITTSCALKSKIRAALPEISSSHCSEAIASGFHFKTHAAFLANSHKKNDLPFSSELMAQRLCELGYSVSNSTIDTMLQNIQPRWNYVIISNRDRSANDSHFHECNKENRPMMMIKIARKYATLEWDCITLESKNDRFFKEDLGNRIARKMFAEFQHESKGATGRPFFEASAFVGSIKKLEPATAKRLAKAYLGMIKQAIPA